MSDRKRPTDPHASGLLGDLESIRSLLDEQADDEPAERQAPPDSAPAGETPVGPEAREAGTTGAASAVPAPPDEDVPLLEDVVQGGIGVDETSPHDAAAPDASGAAGGLDEELFKALLSEEWRESAREMLDQARAAIARHQTEWTPEHTDELNHALKIRIDETLQQWLREVVQTRIHELRQALLAAVSEQIRRTIDEQFDPPPKHEDPDGE